MQRLRIIVDAELRRRGHLSVHAARHQQHGARAVCGGDLYALGHHVEGALTRIGIGVVEISPAAHQRMDAQPVLFSGTPAFNGLFDRDAFFSELHSREPGLYDPLAGRVVRHLRDQCLLQLRFVRRACRRMRCRRQPRNDPRRYGGLQKVAPVHLYPFRFPVAVPVPHALPGTGATPSTGIGMSSVRSKSAAVNPAFIL